MQRSIIILISVVFLHGSIRAQNAKGVKSLETRVHQYARAVEQHDSLFLQGFFHDQMVLTSTTGTYRNKQEEMKELLDDSPQFALDYFVTDSLRIEIFGKTGVVTGLLRWKFKSQPTVIRRVFTFTCIRGKDWQVVAQHIGRIG